MVFNQIRNSIKRYCTSSIILIGAGLATSPILCSCQDEPEIETPTQPEEGTRLISFTLPAGHFSFDNDKVPVVVSLISPSGETQVFKAVVEKKDGSLHFRMALPTNISIADGKYIMTMRHENGGSIAGRLSCLFEKEALTSVSIIIPSYMLPGSGTEEDPYIIGNNDDFELFLINLDNDTESYGAGLKFKQTADVVAPDQSATITGRGYWGSTFAGIYDGDGHAITGLYYRGNGRENSDSGFGIFHKLIGSATIENLSVTGVNVSGLYKESAIISGTTSGDVVFSNITLSGHIEGVSNGYSIGGLTGAVQSGTLSVENINFSASVKGGNNIGALTGKINSGANTTFSNITHDSHFSVEGINHVGGLIGELNGPTIIKNIKIEHKVSNEDSDIRVISGKGEGTGGIIGAITGNCKGVALSDCYILCPIGGVDANNVGGVIGLVENREVTITNCRIYSVVGGKNNVGGIIGKASMPVASNGLTIGGEDYSTKIAVDDADASVSGQDFVGGFAGWWEGPLKLNTKIKINLPISGSGSGVGGAFGAICNSSVDATHFLIGAGSPVTNSLHVSGAREAGGFVGHLEKSTLSSDSRFDYEVFNDNAKIPKADKFIPVFNGVVTGSDMVGGVVGYGKTSTVQGVYSTAHITGDREVGGVIGKMEDETYNGSNVEDCTFAGILNCPAADMVGGIVGHFRSVGSGQVTDCVNYSDILGGDSQGGTSGIIGYISKARPNDEKKVLNIGWCANTAKITGNRRVGGIVGAISVDDSSTDSSGPCTAVVISISDCVNNGTIYGEGGSSSNTGVGGILGFSTYLAGVFRSANHGEVYGNKAFHGIGGIAGSMGHDPTGAGLTTHYRNLLVQQCFNAGSVNAATRSSFVGGILGYQEEGEQSNLEDCANHGEILPNQDHDSGGILGCADHLSYIYRCVNKGKVSHGNATIGTHKNACIFYHDDLYFLEGTGGNWPSAKNLSADLFTVEYQYKGFDFNNVWKMTSDGPMLRKNRWNYILN